MQLLDLQLKHVGAQYVLGKRETVADWAEISVRVAECLDVLGAYVEAPAICRLLSRTEDGYLAEFLFPVAEGTTQEGFEGAWLDADDVIAVTHHGPLAKTENAPGVSATAQQAFGQAIGQKRLIGDNPTRYVFLEASSNGEATRTEIQISYHLPVWLDRLKEGLAGCVDDEQLTQITQDAGTIAASDSPEEIRSWVMSAVERLDEIVEDPQQRACILQDCAHRYPRVQLDRMRAVYDELGDLRTFIDRLAEDKALFPAKIWMDEDGGPIAYIHRSIANREAYDATDDPLEKRFHACFCIMVKDAILTGERVSADFCNCSGGWFVQMWEAILDRRLRIDVLESVLQGHDRCLFAVHLPPELLH